jgi:eukaryotic-like serine/threonine-protein kinase
MTPGSSIGHHKITAKLGEAGMGAVYRATDTKLDRDVVLVSAPGEPVLFAGKWPRTALW